MTVFPFVDGEGTLRYMRFPTGAGTEEDPYRLERPRGTSEFTWRREGETPLTTDFAATPKHSIDLAPVYTTTAIALIVDNQVDVPILVYISGIPIPGVANELGPLWSAEVAANSNAGIMGGGPVSSGVGVERMFSIGALTRWVLTHITLRAVVKTLATPPTPLPSAGEGVIVTAHWCAT